MEPGPDMTSAEPAAASAPTPTRLGPNYYKLMAASTVSNLGDGISIVAYPWLASAVTRNPLLIALVAVVQRLPWLLFTLPAGVITDRSDRRRLMIGANAVRAVITVLVAGVVLFRQGDLPGPDEVAAGGAISSDLLLYGLILVATLLLGLAEVLYDNAAQTFMPRIVDQPNLEKANGRLWSVEMVANTFAGPPLAGLLLVAFFALPFFVDAVSFALSAFLIGMIVVAPRPRPAADGPKTTWTAEAKEGFRWLWHHDLLRPLAVTLGLLNGLGLMAGSIIVLFAQEVLDTSPTEFAIMGTGAAVGGIIGGWTAAWIVARIGDGRSLWLTMIVGGLSNIIIGLIDWWGWVWLLFGLSTMFGVVWNVITVSLRQTIIPDGLLGRVNSVYRFFGWGIMPLGAVLGGLVVWVTEQFGSRDLALRLPWIVSGLLHFGLLAFAAPRLTGAKIAAARDEATGTSLAEGDRP